ncbi:MAG: CBS domain-containing protein, partial [Lachnospiraceae bacterium]|nr:CBS domain-containing protein [Lachnospiraceae bacterium]
NSLALRLVGSYLFIRDRYNGENKMHAFKLIIEKTKVKYLYDYNRFDEGVEILRQSGYSAIPVINRDGTYAGTVCDKDFLLKYTSQNETVSDIQKMTIKDIMRPEWNPAINISRDINDVLLLSMEQNFVPVVDDLNVFIGIITRRDIIKFLSEQNTVFSKGMMIDKDGGSDAKKMEISINQLEQSVAPYEMFTKMYEAAMKEICIRIETINEMLKFKYNRELLLQIENRIKSAKSVLGKLAKKNLAATVDNMRENLHDIAGVRVVCAYLSDVYEFAGYLEEQSDLRIIKRKDYIANPKSNGYRSLHLILEVPVNYIGAMKMIPVEIQFRTEPMDYWASLEHDLKYKPTHNLKGVDISAQLFECSSELAKTEMKMQNLAELITGMKEEDIIF